MPYNTRRKSLSLPSLGIQLPAASRAHRSPSKCTPTSETMQHPSKRVKRSHGDNTPVSPISSTDASVISPTDGTASKPRSRRGGLAHTPPPSPGNSHFDIKTDTEGINDDIVIAVIEQLEKTGNRPHLIKELAAVLASTNDSVAHSANPAALLSSRLSLYLKRPWTALAPCPLAKELIPVHPRKVFFYLTTTPHQKLPESSDDIIAPTASNVKRLTPSVSPSIDQDDIDIETRERLRMSPSPEVDLSSPDLDDDQPMSPPTPGESFSGRSSLTRDGSIAEHRTAQNRAPSPPLEADEKGFTETATAVRARGMSLNECSVHTSIEGSLDQGSNQQMEGIEETAEMTHKRDQELGYELFGHAHGALAVPNQTTLLSSPMIAAKDDHATNVKKVTALVTEIGLQDVEMTNWELRSPENVELDELDGMFSGF
ncbi:hypothetical protein GJ744_001228 [Endocarpon pusillum]|uniref:GDS1 winged helix domain-containing protein n=1 Tax=Endocarpon pusillum TaxID=364733 RepID=A0A8H7ADN4_9EURO|nr:hypothetical protein GJ744_001228 [Endocarpon pusillum]